MEAVVSQTAVVGIDEVELPQRHLAAGDGGLRLPRRMVMNRASTLIHSPGGQPAKAAATTCRRVLAELRTLRARWPLISSIRLNSSISAWVSQRRHS